MEHLLFAKHGSKCSECSDGPLLRHDSLSWSSESRGEERHQSKNQTKGYDIVTVMGVTGEVYGTKRTWNQGNIPS